MFVYQSEQVHSTKGTTRRNIVSIKNGKGFKAVEINDNKGKYYKKKPLTTKELQCIEHQKFVPGLFKDCIKREKIRKTRRQRK
jgi:hypothetical protein